MKIDVISVFPEYLAPLGLSLIGKAQAKGLLDIRVHDLRGWATDRHKTVDDTPYGGGAGMVMRPDIWGQAIDSSNVSGAQLIIPTPSGNLFTQRAAEELAGAAHLIFACGRYEGIDARVAQHYRGRDDVIVHEYSIGDDVLNGGEVAALVMIEAITRLIPGVIGNPESLIEESHNTGGLLEYPVFTKPPVWRDLEIPEILLSGHHQKIAEWRAEQSLNLTEQRRPDLLP